MKKRLLITSIVMMLVVAVALSTATYAWFTSNTSVKADAVVLTASTMDGAAILITHNANGADAQQSIVLTSASTSKLYPATPKATTSFDTFTSDSIANISANFQNLIMGGSGKYTDPNIQNPNVSLYKDTFYVFNKGYQAVTLTPTVTIYFDANDNTSAMAAQSARIAIIERVPSSSTPGENGQVALGSAITANMSTYELKNIWEYNSEAVSTTYVKAPATYDSSIENYYSNDTGTAWSGATITSSNYDENKANLYVAIQKSVAKNAALGSATVGSGYGAVEGTDAAAGTYTQGGVLFTPHAFSQIGVATSSMHIANEYTVVVWLEGWDADCTNAITSGAFRVDLSFDAA